MRGPCVPIRSVRQRHPLHRESCFSSGRCDDERRVVDEPGCRCCSFEEVGDEGSHRLLPIPAAGDSASQEEVDLGDCVEVTETGVVRWGWDDERLAASLDFLHGEVGRLVNELADGGVRAGFPS